MQENLDEGASFHYQRKEQNFVVEDVANYILQLMKCLTVLNRK